MKMIAIIINGIHLPYPVIHYAIEKAKTNSSEIFALFLRGKHERPKGYLFPSDIATTETRHAEREAENEDEKIISNNMDLVKKMIAEEEIPYHPVVRINASVEEVAELISSADLIVIDKHFDENSILGDDKISLKALQRKSTRPIELVS